MEKGTPAWAFDVYFRRKWLSSFTLDLRALEATGFENPKSCPTVLSCLLDIAKILESIPNVRPPAQSLADDFKDLADRYDHWNHKVGDEADVREERIRAHDNLKNKKKRLGDRIGDSSIALKDKISWTTMDKLFDRLTLMVNDESLVGVFDLLSRDLASFPRKTSQYRS